MVISVVILTSFLVSGLPKGPMVCGCAFICAHVSTLKEPIDRVVLFMSCNGFLGILTLWGFEAFLENVPVLKAMFVTLY